MEPNNNPDFQHGYTSGVEGVNRETYEGYLSSQVNTDWLTERIQEKRTELTATEQAIADVTEANRTAYSNLQNHALQVERLDKQVKQREADRQTLHADIDALRERRAKASPDYSLLAGLLFLVAGISFLAGDLIISHEIVAYALNIRDTNEAWAFAVGLAMVSILLKPAYDRLIEKPYLENPEQNRSKYERFKIAIALFSVLTLAVLGWFRYEAYRTDQLKSAINKSVRQLQLNTDPSATSQTLDAATLNKIEKQLSESSELNLALVNSPWALLSFVLSGILFALAGAVCLGIALPVLSAFWFRWLQADPKIWKLRRRLKRLDKEIAPLEAQLTEQRTRENVLQHDLDLLPALDELREQRRSIVADLNDLLAELKLAQTDSRISNFNDGYGQGEANRTVLNDEEQQQLRRELHDLHTSSRVNGTRTYERTGGAADKGQNGKSQELRPHQTIRKFLSDGL
ncbi:LapA family protein [Spirosoma rigui]|uniref:LapA family protein n=1 Tax=Spirosoma rigui TaxID=564064 RepID=UPI0009B0850F|nr:LapA family protein [Spirosoma rigui]